MLRPKQNVGGMENALRVVLRWFRLVCAAFLVVYAIPGVKVRGAELGSYDKMKTDLRNVVARVSEEVVDRYSRLESYAPRGGCGCSFHVCGYLFPHTPCLKTDTSEELSCGGNFPLCGHMLVGIRKSTDFVLSRGFPSTICDTPAVRR